MWKCHKCGKPVYFAERKQSLGRDWHPECLRCEECGKRLHPGQHVEHKGVPYCHVPCYGALFGPQLFGHGTKVESHKSFGQQKDSPKVNGPVLPRSHLESKLKVYNQFYDGKSGEIRSREVNGRLILEGPLRIHWGVHGVIHLKENDDQRTVVTVRKRNSYRVSSDFDSDEDVRDILTDSSYNDISASSDLTTSTDTLSPDDRTDTGIDSGTDTSTSETLDTCSVPEIMPRSLTLPNKLDIKCVEWDELDELLQVERKIDETDKLYQTMPVALPSQASIESTTSTYSNSSSSTEKNENITLTNKITDKTEIVISNNNAQFHDSDDEIYHTMPTSLPKQMNMDSATSTASNDSTEQIESKSIDTNDDKFNGKSPDTSFSLATQSCSKDDTWGDSGNQLNRSMSGPDCLEHVRGSRSPEFDRSSITSCDISSSQDEVVLRKKAVKTGASAIKRRPGKRLSRSKIKRRCSINGHFYDRETSFFTPPHGSQMSVWVTSLVSTQEVINLMLEKYKVDSDGNNFALFVMRDNGEQKRLKDDDYPLLCRVLLGPHEDVVRLFLMDSHNTPEVSNEVAQFLNFTLAECRGILNQYHSQEEKEIVRVKDKFSEMKRRIKQRMDDLKVRL